MELTPIARFEPYKSLDDVPRPVIQKIREIYLKGISAQEIAELIEMPLAWVQHFIDTTPKPDGEGHH